MKELDYPKISIITVCFNAVKSIEATVKNVLQLKYPQIDYIIIDGGSTDGTTDILKKYASKLKYWVSEPDKGIYDAMNKGWDKADTGSFILFLGAGDKIINLPEVASFKNAEIVAGTVNIGDRYFYEPKTDLRLKLGNTLHHQAMLVKKNIHINPPFDLRFKTYADFDFNQRLVRLHAKIYVDKKFNAYALDGGVSTKFDKQESLAVVKKNFGWFYVMLAKIYYSLRHEV